MIKGDLNYLGLIFDCPVGVEVPDCSFRHIRKFKARERLSRYETLSSQERDSMVEKHQRCLCTREKKTLFHESQ